MAKNDDGRDWLRSVTSKHQPTYYRGKDLPGFWHPQPPKKRKNSLHGYGNKWIGIAWIISGLITLVPAFILIILPVYESGIKQFLGFFLVIIPIASVFFWLGYQHFKYQ